MKPTTNPALYWTPRILSLLFIAFLMLFSLDVFDENLGFWGTVLGLFMHNLPALVLLALTIIAWKREIVGAITFIVAGFIYIFLTIVRGSIPWYIAISWSLTIAGPAFVIGVLYLLNGKAKRKSAISSSKADMNTQSARR